MWIVVRKEYSAIIEVHPAVNMFKIVASFNTFYVKIQSFY